MNKYSTDKIRNIALASHSGTGKTSIVESMLFNSKVITRIGNVEEGNTASDYEQEETKRKTSIQTTVFPFDWNGFKLNVLDTPGYADYVGELISGMRAADGIVMVVSAVSGLEAGTEQVWDSIRNDKKSSAIFINKMDRENADFHKVLEELNSKFGRMCVPLVLPVGAESSFEGVIDLLDAEKIPSSMEDQVADYKERLMEVVAESDDALSDKYLENGELSENEIKEGVTRGIASGNLVPVLVGSATQNIGINSLLDILVSYFPSPASVPSLVGKDSKTSEEIEIKCTEAEPLLASVFKTMADPFVGKLSYLRVHRGVLKGGQEIWNISKGQAERIGQVLIPSGKSQEQTNEVGAGDICAVAKLAATRTGDTLGLKDSLLTVNPIEFPTPYYSVAVSPKNKADVDKMSTALNRLSEEDPTMLVSQDQSTGQIVLYGIGDTHVTVLSEKAGRKFGVELSLADPKVAYKETISKSTKVEYKHKKQSGGHGQYGHVVLGLEPVVRGNGFEFGQKVVGGNVPKEYFPAVEKGVIKSLQKGCLSGCPVVDVKVTLLDGSYHPVDSSGMAFEIAGSYALRKGLEDAAPLLLEPVVSLNVKVPDSFTGDVIGDLNGKRAKILGMNPESGVTEIEAEVPQAEVLHYSTDLRSLSQGRGSFSLEFLRYDEVPSHLTDKLVEAEKDNT